MSGERASVGPVQLVILGFETSEDFHGEVANELLSLRGRGMIRVLDARALNRTAGGQLIEVDLGPLVADWPEDIALFNSLLLTGPGAMVEVPSLTFRFMPLNGFSTAANSKVPHNALHDARALRDHVLTLEP
jgi:hypothetical protein